VGENDGLLDLDPAPSTAMHLQSPADKGFRAGAAAVRSEDVHLTGYFHDTKHKWAGRTPSLSS
jgi:hypothetical protein